MFKKTITYTDFNGVEQKEDFYFNLTEAELTEMAVTENGGLDAYLEKIVNERDTRKIVDIFKTVILKAYGEKSPDGKYFVKNDQVRERFAQTAAYSELFMEMLEDSKAAAAFFVGLVPEKLARRFREQNGESLEETVRKKLPGAE